MVFINIKNSVSKKIKLINESEETERLICNLFLEFIRKTYGFDIAAKIKFDIIYSLKNKDLTIKTYSKVFTNDLILRIHALNDFLNIKHIKIKKIIIK